MYNKTRLPFYVLLLFFLYPVIGGKQLTLRAQDETSGPDVPFISITDAAAGTPVFAPCDGELITIESDEPWGVRAIISTKETYYLAGKQNQVEYQMVIGGLREVSANTGPIKAGDPLGSSTKNVYLSARSAVPDSFMIRSSDRIPGLKDGMWWFSPDWLIDGHTLWLSFRQVESFADAVEDFIYRWEREKNEPGGCTVHYFPDFDRIRILLPLSAYPVPITNRTLCLSVAENVFYGVSMIHTHESLLHIGKRNVMLYWQKDFDGYLRKEYTLGQDLWLYLSLVALDHEQDLIVVFVRDFARVPDEDVIKKRQQVIKEKEKKNDDSAI